MVIFEFARPFGLALWAPYSGTSGVTSAALRLLRTWRNRVATAAINTSSVRAIENAVHGKCGVVNSLTKFFED